MSFFLGIDFAFAVALGWAFWRKPARTQADLWMIILLAGLAMIFAGLAMNRHAGEQALGYVPVAVLFGASGFLLPLALTFFYIRAAIGRLQVRDIWVFLPAVVHCGLLVAMGDHLEVQGGLIVLRAEEDWRFMFANAMVAVTLTFPVLGLIELRKYQHRIKNETASLDGLDLAWMRVFLTSVLVGTFLGGTAVWLLGRVSLLPDPLVLILAVFTAQLCVFGYFGLSQRALPVLDDETPSLADQQAWERLQAYFQTASPYMDDALSRDSLATQMGWAPGTISAALKAGETSFYDFINGHRTAAAKRLLSDPVQASTSLLRLGLEAGFKSKASFNRVFKAMTGETPSQYRRRTLSGGDEGEGG